MSEDEVNFVCIFTGFAESRPWECRVFSFEIARTSQKSRVFPFTFAPSCRQSYVLFVFPGKGLGPGFSFSCPLGVWGSGGCLTRGGGLIFVCFYVSDRGRRINFTVFLRVFFWRFSKNT